MTSILSELRKENYIRGLSVEYFSIRAAYYMAELNIIHPFREGNGRATREFMRCLGVKSGFIINWHAIDKEILLQASILSVNDSSELAKCIQACIENNLYGYLKPL